MKTCPLCQTKYTDDTLKFCLQDGTSLDATNDDKTEVFDKDSFSNEETIAENYSDKTNDFAKETIAFTNKQTNANQQSQNVNQAAEQLSDETVLRQRHLTQSPTFENKPKAKIGGLGILAGFIIALIVVGFIGLGVLAFIFLPEMLDEEANTNNNAVNTNSNLTKEKILSDSSEVKVSASSSRKNDKGNLYDPKLAFDGNSRTAWCEGASGTGIGQWIVFDFDKEVVLKEIIIEPGYFKTNELWRKNNRLSKASFKFSDGKSRSVDFPNIMKEQKINAENVKTKSVMITITGIYPGLTDSKDTLISEVSFVVQQK